MVRCTAACGKIAHIFCIASESFTTKRTKLTFVLDTLIGNLSFLAALVYFKFGSLRFVVGAHAVLKRARQQPQKYPWLTQLLARKPFKVVAVALAWHAPLGHCWPRAAPIGRLRLRQRPRGWAIGG